MKKLRKFAAFILCFALALQLGAVPAVADELEEAIDEIVFLADDSVIASGSCGANLTWELTGDGVLTISGSGRMYGGASKGSPFYYYRDKIKSAVILQGVTNIGGFDFEDCTNLTSITIPNSVTDIGSNAFRGCSSLTEVRQFRTALQALTFLRSIAAQA